MQRLSGACGYPPVPLVSWGRVPACKRTSSPNYLVRPFIMMIMLLSSVCMSGGVKSMALFLHVRRARGLKPKSEGSARSVPTWASRAQGNGRPHPSARCGQRFSRIIDCTLALPKSQRRRLGKCAWDRPLLPCQSWDKPPPPAEAAEQRC